MRRLKHLRFRLRVGILGAFLIIVLPLTAAMIGVLYQQNSDLAISVAKDAMRRASTNISLTVDNKLNTMVRGVELATAFGRSEGDRLRHPTSWQPIYDELVGLPELYSLYFGFASDGGFLQVVRLAPDLRRFGPYGQPLPEGAHYVLRLIDNASGEMTDSYFYLAGWGNLVRLERAEQVAYDPRQRPWYDAALRGRRIVNSGVYAFQGTGLPGMTLSREVRTDDGQVIGVFGIDLTLDALSGFIAQEKVGAQGRVFILDENGRLVGYPDPSRIVRQVGGRMEVIRGTEIDDPVVADAIRLHDDGNGDQFRATLGKDGGVFLVSFQTLPPVGGEKWTIGVIAAEEDFVGQMRTASLRILVVGSIFMLVIGFGVARATRYLVKPIASLIDETRLIRRLQLDDDIAIFTPIIEISDLTLAVASMKAALRSFGRYVPKDVVRGIVASDGASGALGGRRQPLTVLFTDLAGFSKASEALPPETVLETLSCYFDAMVTAIHAQNGTVDKFIGDAIMAFWNAPQPDAEHVVKACRAMLLCRQEGQRLNERLIAAGQPPLHTRLGLHSGTAVVGNVGSSDRMQYTALGSMVNLASRVEGMNKYFGTELLVTGAIVEAAEELFLFRPLGKVVAAGTTVPVPVYELIGAIAGMPQAASAEFLARCRAWSSAFSLYQAGNWGRAETAFAAFLDEFGPDGAAMLYRDQCQRFQAAPPPADWDGALHLDNK